MELELYHQFVQRLKEADMDEAEELLFEVLLLVDDLELINSQFEYEYSGPAEDIFSKAWDYFIDNYEHLVV